MSGLTISTNSWHYKLYRLSFSLWQMGVPEYNNNLCRYMRRIFFLPLAIFLVAFMIGFTSIGALLFGWYPHTFSIAEHWYQTYSRYDTGKFKAWYIGAPALFIAWTYFMRACHLFALKGIMLGVVAFIGIAVSLICWLSTTNDDGVIRNWIRAKLQGVCPLIEFKDGK